MPGRSLFYLVWVASMSLALLAFGHEGRALELITAQEARLPDDPEGIRYGVAVGPSIIVVSPSATASSGLPLRSRSVSKAMAAPPSMQIRFCSPTGKFPQST